MSTTPLVFDLETSALPNAADYLEPIPDAVLDDSPIEPAKHLTDPVKVAASIAQRMEARAAANEAAIERVQQMRREQVEKAALDWNVGRIVALGMWTEEHGIQVFVCPDEDREREALMVFWEQAKRRTLVGYAVKGFDLRYMVQRSRLLGVPHPCLDLGKFGRSAIVDLYLELTFNEGTYDKGVMRRTLHAFSRRFGLIVGDTITGADIPALVAAGNWDAVVEHVTSDVDLTVSLAKKLGVVRQTEMELVR